MVGLELALEFAGMENSSKFQQIPIPVLQCQAEMWNSVTHKTSFTPTQSQELQSLQILSSHKVGIRSGPAYPGERTGQGPGPGEVHEFKARVIVPHEQHNIYFYELADGRG